MSYMQKYVTMSHSSVDTNVDPFISDERRKSNAKRYNDDIHMFRLFRYVQRTELSISSNSTNLVNLAIRDSCSRRNLYLKLDSFRIGFLSSLYFFPLSDN